MRVQGELLKLGINVSATTVATALRVSGLGPAPRRVGPSWSEFLRAQAQSMLGAGLPSGPAGGLEGNESARSLPHRGILRVVGCVNPSVTLLGRIRGRVRRGGRVGGGDPAGGS
jgi:hypothetical protein